MVPSSCFTGVYVATLADPFLYTSYALLYDPFSLIYRPRVMKSSFWSTMRSMLSLFTWVFMNPDP